MKTIRVLGLLACVLLVAGAASAREVAIHSTVDYTRNQYPSEPWPLYYFWHSSLDPVIDHTPYYRHMWEDWGWAHDLTSRAPADANGILSATLAISAWDVDEDEVDNIYVHNGTSWEHVGQLQGAIQTWSVTSFTLTETLRQRLLSSRQLHVYMDIDYTEMGRRVTLANSTLDVTYTVTGEVVAPNVAIHRFWSNTLLCHFYTANEAEKDYVIATWPVDWTYEGPVYHAFDDVLDSNLRPVYRFWSNTFGSHFYTISETERDYVMATWPVDWTFEGPVFYAYPEGQQPAGTLPVYRFWSNTLAAHFYTISESEKDYVIATWPVEWTFEGIAWYAYE